MLRILVDTSVAVRLSEPGTPQSDACKQSIAKHQVKGKNVHDARLVAAMNRQSIRQVLTLNEGDFAHYSSITAITPVGVLKT